MTIGRGTEAGAGAGGGVTMSVVREGTEGDLAVAVMTVIAAERKRSAFLDSNILGLLAEC